MEQMAHPVRNQVRRSETNLTICDLEDSRKQFIVFECFQKMGVGTGGNGLTDLLEIDLKHGVNDPWC